jgi:proline dehydrogenase
MPRSLVGSVARRYIAGDTLADAHRTVADLAAQGFLATLDVLGEDVATADEADQSLAVYLQAVDAIAAWPERASVSLSLKPTQFGLRADTTATAERLATLVDRASAHGIFVRLDMEDASTTVAILGLHDALADHHPGGVGTVLQAMLFRTRLDAAALASAGGRDVRLCKGIYIEPPSLAWQEHQGVRDNFVAVARQLLQGGVRTRMATHDTWLIDALRGLGADLGVPPGRLEFQALLGVPVLKTLGELRDAGHPVRFYVPFGPAWYAYSIRRLYENPRVVGHVARGLLSRQR